MKRRLRQFIIDAAGLSIYSAVQVAAINLVTGYWSWTEYRSWLILQLLEKYGSVPGRALALVLRSRTRCDSNSLTGKLRDEGYVEVSKQVFNGHISSIFTITKKGRQALKQSQKTQ
jgi:hypothetical protein